MTSSRSHKLQDGAAAVVLLLFIYGFKLHHTFHLILGGCVISLLLVFRKHLRQQEGQTCEDEVPRSILSDILSGIWSGLILGFFLLLIFCSAIGTSTVLDLERPGFENRLQALEFKKQYKQAAEMILEKLSSPNLSDAWKAALEHRLKILGRLISVAELEAKEIASEYEKLILKGHAATEDSRKLACYRDALIFAISNGLGTSEAKELTESALARQTANQPAELSDAAKVRILSVHTFPPVAVFYLQVSDEYRLHISRLETKDFKVTKQGNAISCSVHEMGQDPSTNGDPKLALLGKPSFGRAYRLIVPKEALSCELRIQVGRSDRVFVTWRPAKNTPPAPHCIATWKL